MNSIQKVKEFVESVDVAPCSRRAVFIRPAHIQAGDDRKEFIDALTEWAFERNFKVTMNPALGCIMQIEKFGRLATPPGITLTPEDHSKWVAMPISPLCFKCDQPMIGARMCVQLMKNKREIGWRPLCLNHARNDTTSYMFSLDYLMGIGCQFE